MVVNGENSLSARIVSAPQLPMFSEFRNLLKSHKIRLEKNNVCLSFLRSSIWGTFFAFNLLYTIYLT